MTKKIVVKLELQDDKAKQKAMKTVSTLSGIDSIAMDMKEKKLMVIGVVDPINIVTKLRKYWPTTDILLVGPAKEPEKPPEKKEEGGKQEEGKKEEAKKEAGGGGGEEQKKEEGKKEGEEAKKEGEDGGDGKKEEEEEKKPVAALPGYDPVIMEMVKAYKAYNPQLTSYYYVPSMEENPNACSIC